MRIRIHQYQQCDLLPVLRKALCHFQTDQPPERVSNEYVWATGLEFANGLEIERGHILYASKWFLQSINAFGMKSIDRVVCANAFGEFQEFRAAIQAMCNENTAFSRCRFELHQGRKAWKGRLL